jgi:hypothetical protein
MDSSNTEYITEYIEIPSVFYCQATQKPFEECLVCKTNLLKADSQYVIEKAIRQYPGFSAKDVVSEYAICLDCNNKMQDTLSGHSKKLINDYFNQRVDLAGRRQRLLREKGTNLQAWLSNCLIYDTPQQHTSEYQIYAQCAGNYLLFTVMPFMISGRAIEEIADQLSAETKDVLDDFIDQHFGLPPELKSLLKDRKLILL